MLAQRGGTTTPPSRYYRRSLEINERIGDQAGMAASYHQLGMLAQTAGDYDAAEPLYRRSLEISERIGDQAGMATSYHQLGILAQPRGDYDAAEPLPPVPGDQRAHRRPGGHGHQLPPARHAGPARGDYDAAEPLYRRALEISERIGDQAGMSTSYHQLGMLAQDRGDYDAAEPLYRRSLEISERIGDLAGIATSYTALGGLSEAAREPGRGGRLPCGCPRHPAQDRHSHGRRPPALAGLRRRLGRDRFRAAALASGLDEESAGNLMQMLDQHDEGEETAGD